MRSLDLVDVFGSSAFAGNPLGVVRGGEGLSTQQMVKLTQWLGFSETTFLLPPEDLTADYKLRIFCPGGELPFAGHPTLGSCHAWLAAGGKPKCAGRIVQECGAGLVEIRQEGEELAFAAPPLTQTGPLSEAERAAAILAAGVDPAAVVEAVHVSNGPKWQMLRLRSADDVLAAEPLTKVAVETFVGLAGPYAPGGDADWELRAFFSNQHLQLVEDPVTGSFNASAAMHLFSNGLASASYRASQGRKVGADGRISCTQSADGKVWIGGRCDTIAQGASLPAFG